MAWEIGIPDKPSADLRLTPSARPLNACPRHWTACPSPLTACPRPCMAGARPSRGGHAAARKLLSVRRLAARMTRPLTTLDRLSLALDDPGSPLAAPRYDLVQLGRHSAVLVHRRLVPPQTKLFAEMSKVRPHHLQ